MEKFSIQPLVCECGLHLATLFLLIFCLPNYKIVSVVLIIMYLKKKNDFFIYKFLDVECTNRGVNRDLISCTPVSTSTFISK